MKKFKVKEDCYCEGYLHELNFYSRKGLEARKLKKGNKVKLVKEWENPYGKYYRVIRKGIQYDIPKQKLKPIKK